MKNTTENTTVSVTTLGCKSNQYDSGAIEESLAVGGLTVVPFPARAEVYVINTCTVTKKTDYQSRQLIRRVRRLNPSATVIVTGCYAQVSPEEVSAIEGVDYVLGNPEKDKVLKFALKGRNGDEPVRAVGDFKAGASFALRSRGAQGRTRANLKVQDGCSKFCSYCIIPRARGLSKSLPIAEVEREIELLIEAGFKEIVLTGIHLGAWGGDLDKKSDLTGILRLIEDRAYPCRFRISSLDPDEVTDEFIEIMAGAKRICNHLHLPLQSGDGEVLKRMRRDHTPEVFADAVERLYRAVPGISIGTDVIVGFPGEGDAEFENTAALIRSLPVSYLHVFPYSARPGTQAASFTPVVDGNTIKARCGALKEVDAAKRKTFYSNFIGSVAEVLIEGTADRQTGLAKGKARNYIPVLVTGGAPEPNTCQRVRLTGLNGDGMSGTVI